MANRQILVLVNGELQQLQAGDVVVDNLGNVLGAVLTGSGAPGAIGKSGDLYINTIQGDISYKVAGVWQLSGANAYFLQGKALDASVVSPTNGDVLTYDSTLAGGVGAWKSAASAGGAAAASYVTLGVAIPNFL